MSKFLNTLFNPGEYVVSSNTIYETKVTALQDVDVTKTMLSINPQCPVKNRRADSNVTAFRNILVELDSETTKEQMAFIKQSGLPTSTCTFSGNKSLHFIISLKTELTTKTEYRNLVNFIYRALDKIRPNFIDSSCKNPSRFSIMPDTIRPDNGKKKNLIYVKSRVNNQELLNWAESKLKMTFEQFCEKRKKYTNAGVIPSEPKSYKIPARTEAYLKFGAPEGQRNKSLFMAACDLAQCGYSIGDIISKTETIADLPEQEMLVTINSAYNKVLNKGDL